MCRAEPGSRSARGRGFVRTAQSGLLIALLWTGLSGCEAQAPRPPNVVLISVDTLRADRMGLYGYGRDTTPHIDAFFRDRTVIDTAITTAPCTVPAIRQLLTGRLDRKAEGSSLPERLSDAGYRTAAIVSQHQFRWDGLAHYARGFAHFDVQGVAEVDHHRMTSRRAEEVSDLALAWLDEDRSDEPFFLWLHYFDPHDPYTPPVEYRGYDTESVSILSGDRRAASALYSYPDPQDNSVLAELFGVGDVAHLRNLYDGEIQYVDAQIGRVLTRLEERGLVETSVIVFTSDHGERLGETPMWDHCKTLHRFETQVPLLVSDRGRPAALAGGGAASTVDLVPTILDLVGIPFERSRYDGVPLEEADATRVVSSFWRGKRVLWDGRWKLYLGRRGRPVALYDLRSDPDENTDILADRPGVVRRLRIADPLSRATVDRSSAASKGAFTRLKALGYVE